MGVLVAVAQWLERLPVEQEVAGSNLVSHPFKGCLREDKESDFGST